MAQYRNTRNAIRRRKKRRRKMIAVTVLVSLLVVAVAAGGVTLGVKLLNQGEALPVQGNTSSEEADETTSFSAPSTSTVKVDESIDWPEMSEVTEESVFPDQVFDVPVYTSLIPEGKKGRPGKQRKIMYIVIHETDNQDVGADAANHANFLNNVSEDYTSWHYTVDDHEIYHHVPDNEVAWHAGDQQTLPGGNMNGIGVELCVNPGNDFEKTFQNAAKLTAYLIDAYDLTIDAVKQHGDFMWKNCPATIRDTNRTQEFKDTVAKYLAQLQ